MLARFTFSKRQWVGGLAVSALSLGLGLALSGSQIGEGLTRRSYDLQFAFRPEVHPDEAAIIYMDDTSHLELKQPSNAPWDRKWHAQLIGRLTADGARLIVCDIIFSDPAPDKDAEQKADPLLARSIKQNANVILAADYTFQQSLPSTPGTKVTMPIDLLRKEAAGIGLAALVPDSDYGVRRQFRNREQIPTLAEVAVATVRTNGGPVAGRQTESLWINYYGPPGTIPGYSYSQAVLPGGVATNTFKNKVVFIGAGERTGFTKDIKDSFATPFTFLNIGVLPFSSGVEIHATIFLNLLRNESLRKFSRAAERMVLAVCGLILGLGLTSLRPQFAALWAVAGVIGVVVAASLCVWTTHHWFSWLIIVAVQIPAALVASLIYNAIRLYIAKQVHEMQIKNLELETANRGFRIENLELGKQSAEAQARNLELEKQALETQARNLALEKETVELRAKTLEESLSKHLSPARVQQLKDRPDLLRPKVDKMELSILFSDIENFSKYSETLPAEELGRVLNNYYETALACVFDTQGAVIKLIGDCIFAVWNAPIHQPDHQWLACRSALLLAEKLDEFGDIRRDLPCRTRVGIHTGVACIGNVGSSDHFNYDALGESINLTQRLEGLNKYLETQILASLDIQQKLKDRVISRNVGTFRFKGFGRSVKVHEILGLAETWAGSRQWIVTFETALANFQAKKFDAANAGFGQTIQMRQDLEQQHLSPEFRTKDGPSVYFLNMIEKYRTTPPGSGWIGEVNMDEK